MCSSARAKLGAGDPDTTDTSDTGTSADETIGGPLPLSPTYLWYSVDQSLIYIELNPADGTAVEVVANELVPDVPRQHRVDDRALSPSTTPSSRRCEARRSAGT